MYDTIAQIIVMASLGVMIYIIARAAPRIGDDLSVLEEKRTRASLVSLERIDGIVNSALEKTLRRTKLILMQLDNVVSNYLHRVKRITKYHEEKPNLFENLQEEIKADASEKDRA